MSKKYNIVERLKQKNQRPKIQITNDLEVTVNTSAQAGVILRSYFQEENFDLEKIESALKLTIGEHATNEVLGLDLTLEALVLLLETISAAFTGEELPEEEQKDSTFQEASVTAV